MTDNGVASKPVLRQDLEFLRIASAFGIVLFHSGRDAYEIGYGGLVVFLILSSYFATAHAKVGATIRQILTKRASRLLAPWAVWMVLYGARNHFFADRNILETDRGWINGVLAGTQIHLWFLPYMFFVSVGLDVVVPRVSKLLLGWLSGMGAIAVLAGATIWRPWAELHGYPSVQYAHAVAGILIGILFACRTHLKASHFQSLLLAVFGAIGMNLARHVSGIAVPYLVGTLLCSVVLLWPLRLPAKLDVTPVSECMFGVYLGHIFFDRIYNITPGLPDLWEPPLTFASSLLVIWLFRRYLPRVARWAT